MEPIVIGDCPLAIKRNITKQLLPVRDRVWDSNNIRVRRNINFECSIPWIVSCHYAGAI